MEIKYADYDDVDSWCGLVEKVKDNFPGLDMKSYRESLGKCITLHEALAVIDNEKRIVGALLFSYETSELLFLAVDPCCRKQGIATALVLKMVSLFPSGSKISVITYRENDPIGKEARGLYRELGFQEGALIKVFDYPCQELYYIVPA